MENILLFSTTSKLFLNKIEIKYGIDIDELKIKIKNRYNIKKKKLVKIDMIFELIWFEPVYKNILINELTIMPIYVPNKTEKNWIVNIKKINSFMAQFNHLLLDIDVKEIFINVLYLFIYYIHHNFNYNQINPIINDYIIKLIGIDKLVKKDILTLQEIIFKCLLIEIINQGYEKFTLNDMDSFIINIKNPIIKEILNLSLITYKKIILISH
jgi:hypothetical protein